MLLVEGRKAVVRYMSTVSGTRAGAPEPQTMDLNPKPEAVGPSEDYSVRVSHDVERHSLPNPSSCLYSMGLDLRLGHSQHAVPPPLSQDRRQEEAFCGGRAGWAVFPEQGVK